MATWTSNGPPGDSAHPGRATAAGRQGLPPDLAGALHDLARRRPDIPLGVTWAQSLPSTMDVVAAAGESGAPEGVVVGAETQTEGRGRRGRSWLSPPGTGLYFSYLARPTRHIELVTLAAGVAVREAVARTTGLSAELKWPNDVMCGGRKLAGLLAEASRVGTPEVAVTIGVGLNVRPFACPPDLRARATCLELEVGRVIDRGLVLAAVLERLTDAMRSLSEGDADGILRAWRRGAPSSIGTRVEWVEGTTRRGGITAGIDDAGALLVRTPAGVERVVAGTLDWAASPSAAPGATPSAGAD